MGNTNGKLNPNTIIEKIKEEAEQKVLVSLNLFASAIDLHGYTPANHRGFTKRIVEDFMELLALVQSTERAEALEEERENLKMELMESAIINNGLSVGAIKAHFEKLSINGNVEDKSKEVLASSEVENLTPISNNSKQLSKKKGKL